MRPICILAHEARRLVPLLIPQIRDASVRERLGTRGPAGLQDRREQAEELDPRGSHHHVLEMPNKPICLPRRPAWPASVSKGAPVSPARAGKREPYSSLTTTPVVVLRNGFGALG